MAFPLGLRVALRRAPLLAPWFWGVNGAASVCASVLAVVIAIGAGISAAFWTGTVCYVVALAAIRIKSQAPSSKSQPTPNRQIPDQGSQDEPEVTPIS